MTKHDFWRLLNYIEPFDEYSPQASGSTDLDGSSSNRGDAYSCTQNVETYTHDDEHVHAINMAGCLA